MFADDTKIYSVIKIFDDCLRLLQDLNQLSQWSTVWLFRFNAAKYKVMHIGYSPTMSYTMTDSSTNSSVVLEEVNEEKDLGVWCTNTLKPSLHCQRAAVNATQVLGLARRSFKIKSQSIHLYGRPFVSKRSFDIFNEIL